MSAFSATIAVSAANYPLNPQVDLPWEPKQWAFVNLATIAAAEDVRISWDGVNDHLISRSDQPSKAIGENNRYKKVWLRVIGGGPVSVDVMVGSEV